MPDLTAPETHTPPDDATCPERWASLGVAHACSWISHEGDVHRCVCGDVWSVGKSGCRADPSAPVTAEGLRERITETATEWALMYPLANYGFWSCADGAGTMSLNTIADSIAKAWGRDIADRVLAVLVEPPGDLREQTAEAIRSARCEHPESDGYACVNCIAEAALSARWENAARRIAAAEARADAAERSEHALHKEATEAHAETRAVRAQVAALEGERDGLHETIAAADADRDRLEGERDALAAAARKALEIRQTHHKTDHAHRLLDPNCTVCQMGLALSAGLPSRPDDPEEIRRLAQATTEETTSDER